MNFGISKPTAILLPNGKVLVTGAVGVVTPGAAEVYDPGRETWTPLESMTTNRFWHTATLLQDGTVLIAAGAYVASSALQTTEIYNSTKINVTPFTLSSPQPLPNASLRF